MLPVQNAGPLEDLIIEGTNPVTLTNVLVGDVWIC